MLQVCRMLYFGACLQAVSYAFHLIDDHEGTNEGQGEYNEEFYNYTERELSNENIEVSIHALA